MPHATNLVAWGVVSATRSLVALGARDDWLNSPYKRVTVPEMVRARLHPVAPWLTRGWLTEVSRHHLVIASFSSSQDDRHKLRWLRPSILDKSANATTIYPTSKDNLITRTCGYAGAVADNVIIPHLLHDNLTSSAVDAGKDALQEWTNSGMDVRWRTVKDPFSSGQLPMGFGHGSHTSSLTFVRSGFYRILLYHFL